MRFFDEFRQIFVARHGTESKVYVLFVCARNLVDRKGSVDVLSRKCVLRVYLFLALGKRLLHNSFFHITTLYL